MVHENLKIYRRPPTSQEILSAVSESNLKKAEFERIHGLYKDSICQALKGTRNIPVKHWHLFIKEKKKLSKSQSASKLKTNAHLLNNTVSEKPSDSEELGSLIDKLTG